MVSKGLIAILASSAVTLAGVRAIAKRRQQSRLPKNPSGIADANLSIAERREAAEEVARGRDTDSVGADFQDSSQEGTSG